MVFGEKWLAELEVMWALTGDDDGVHGQLVASLLNAAVESLDVFLLPERVRLRKHGLYLTHLALFKPPQRGKKSVIIFSSVPHRSNEPDVSLKTH